MSHRLSSDICITVLIVTSITVSIARAQSWTMQVDVKGKRYVGSPLAWDTRNFMLLGRNGHLWTFEQNSASDYKKTSEHFRPFSQGEMRGQLLAEYGRSFEISGTGNYIVVHPKGQKGKWATRFEELFRSFQHYFAARGWKPRAPQFPLVAVVAHNAQEFRVFAERDGARVSSGVLGYYSPTTNRVLLYDTGREPADWSFSAETIIHEAAHQTAFNTGVHSRFAPTPRWLAEGLGLMFERPGVYNSKHYLNFKDRVNVGRLQSFRQYLGKRPKGSLAEFVATDRLFKSNPDRAYAEAWALSFYLVENYPRQYITYLRTVARRKPFQEYDSNERLSDFIRVFGRDLKMLETRYLRYIAGIR